MKKIVYIAIAAVLAYGAYLFGKPYVNSHFLQSQMQGLADKADLKTDAEIITELVEFSRERGMSLNRKDFRIKRDDGRIYISVKYTEVVEIPHYSREYKFSLEAIS